MNTRSSRGFALPTVLIASVVMLIVLLLAIQSVVSVSEGIRGQYKDKLGKEAASSGVAMAKACIAKNGSITWTNTQPLKPNTDCTGVETTSCPSNSTDTRCYVLIQGLYRSTYSVGVISDTSNNPTDISVQGIVREVRKTSGDVAQQNTISLKASMTNAAATPVNGAISVSTGFTCGIANGSVYCTGNNSSGQLGDGTTTTRSTPAAVGGALAGKTVTQLITANSATNFNGWACAIASGQLYCWGSNNYGQLGDGTTNNQSSPVLVGGALAGKTVTQVVATGGESNGSGYNDAYTCAIASAQLYCWGMNSSGQLGYGSIQTDYPNPTLVSGLSGKTVTAVTANVYITGAYFPSPTTCAVADSQAYCWGSNSRGQLGDGTTTDRTSPVLAGGALSGKIVTQIFTTSIFSCAIASGQVYCWGYNADGELGDGTTTTRSTPAAVGGALAGKTVDKLSLSLYGESLESSACAIASAQLYCWGSNNYGQLGDGTTNNQSSPVLVGGALAGKTVTQVSTAGAKDGSTSSGYNGAYTCAIASAQLYCWGTNSTGQLGYGAIQTVYPNPTLVSGLSGKTVTAMSAHIYSTGSYWGAGTTCAVADGILYCWGNNSNGEVGNGTTTTQTAPVMAANQGGLPTGSSVLSVMEGNYHTCAVTSKNNVYCWGYNSVGQLGNNSTTNSSVPVAVSQGAVPSGVTLKSITAGGYHTCAIGSDNKAYCWGYNNYGQLGNNSTTNSSVPVAVSQGAVPSGVTLKSIAAGYYHTCAIGSDNKAYCWGYGTPNGQLGTSVAANSSVPVAVSQGAVPSGVTLNSITAAGFSSCALGSDSKAYCWGGNNYGGLGNNSTTNSSVPVAVSQGAVPSGVTLKSVTMGYYHTCAIGSDNKAYCWGYNGYGQLGNNSTTNSSVPVAVSQGAFPTGVTSSIVTLGIYHTCAIGSDSNAYCWGYNPYGGLGNNSTTNSSVPVPVSYALNWGSSSTGASGGGLISFYY